VATSPFACDLSRKGTVRKTKTPSSSPLGDRAVRTGDQFEEMAVRVVEIDAATPVEVVDLPGPFAAKIRVMRDARGADAGKCSVELGFADQKGVVLGAKVRCVGKIEGDPVAGAYRDEMASLGSGFQV
jgi:hypothetical protein